MAPKRQLTEAEKQQVLLQHGRRCFVDGAPIPEEEALEFHHILAWSEDGPTKPENIAPVCRKHHLSIGTMSLQEYRDKLELGRFFGDGKPKYLDDLIAARCGHSGLRMTYEVEDGAIVLYFANAPHRYPLETCPTTRWPYFYATLPVEFIGNDRDLQPRALREAPLWSLYRHFQTNTQLAPSVCRMDETDHILLFDGQHKAAAQIWAGRTMVECKVYLHPNPRVLKETNLTAHGNLRQMPFYSEELMRKYADIFGADWADYMAVEGETRSESGFVAFLFRAKGKPKEQAKREITLAIQYDVLRDPSNGLSPYVAEKPRGSKLPLAFSRLKKTVFLYMLVPPPVSDEFESDTDFRDDEKRNLVRLMSIIAEEGLEGRWAPERADSTHKKAERIFSAGAVRAWVILLTNVINTHLRHYTDEERRRFLYRRIDDKEFVYFRDFVRRIFSHKLWDDPDPSGQLTARLAKDDMTTARSLFDEQGLTVQWVLGQG